jgi:hypothetical protein
MVGLKRWWAISIFFTQKRTIVLKKDIVNFVKNKQGNSRYRLFAKRERGT